MSDERVYLDHAATTPLLPAAREAMLAGFDLWANPSSPHAPGRAARAALENARERLKEILCWDGEVIFTSGASEAIAIAIGQCARVLEFVSPVEHDSVLRLSPAAVRLGVDACGRVCADFEASGGLVAVQHVNSETGVIQQLEKVSVAAHASDGILLADCAQSAGKIALPDADLVAIGAHKFGGPVGVGALLVRDWALLKPVGGQERGYRGGTENLPGILATVAALEAGSGWLADARRMRELLEAEIIAAGGEVIARDAERLATIGSYRMPGVSSASQLIRFDAMGIAVSAGSACSSGSLKTSHVLQAMGMNDKAAAEVIRVSFGRETTEDHVARFLDGWRAIAAGRVAA